MVGLHAGWTLSECESPAFDTTFYPNLEESGEFRNLTTLGWKMSMTQGGSLAMKIGLSNEYDSLASDDTEKNDFRYYLSQVWGL
ncbi:MAG: hypothetical protein ABFR65_02900 [Pseudomonadota bacterium]